MKFTICILLLALCSLTSSHMLRKQPKLELAETSSNPKPYCVTLYYGKSYGGTSVEYCGDTSSFGSTHNNEFSSIKIGSYVLSAILYKRANYEGKSKTITSNVSNFRNINFSNEASSLKINMKRSYCCTFYTGYNYGGSSDSICYGNDVSNLGSSFGHA